ncbi:peptidoglycan recognition protein family protein [Anaerovorax odorimutans]|uniref:peptidoglycan recognition protein family protein n=1 Tax=Anaerovorax odorimutans TaxID=109327 RepID=UPI000428BABE|nr:N-acetylmuramoyl-L-alanine amidase [Anaerovorax odorimutans]
MEYKTNLTLTNFTKGRNSEIKFIVIHYTANDGDTDESNASYFHILYRGASAHCFIDENSCTKVVNDSDTAWHCNDSQKYTNGGAAFKNICNNDNSIGIEMCSDIVDGKYVITEATVNNTVEAVKRYMNAYSIPVKNVIRHFDVTGKICPEPFVKDESKWEDFKDRLEEEEMQERYSKVSELPKSLQEEVQELVDSGALKGDGNGNLNITEDMARCMIINKRYVDSKK